ncbi:GNAT family N-acetyltransferase [Patescibacteria group bacterium]|nr:GNAT family N-acetyltransferase [Patescibacteria group bacterium]MBU1895945.1 GNAT family N-acetyltransferase [Patescibacteria group bacterium]
MSNKVEIRRQRVSDAKRFFEILTNPNFIYFTANPKSMEDEKEWLRGNTLRRKQNFAHSFSILYKNDVAGGCGLKINQHRQHEGEVGYFVDEKYWGNGIATKAVKKLEKIGFGKLRLKRIIILMNPKNIASKKVAIKCGYKKEGLMKKAVFAKGKYHDVYLYAKVK